MAAPDNPAAGRGHHLGIVVQDFAAALQEMLAYLGFLDPTLATGRFGDGTAEAVRSYQAARGLSANGIANMKTQQLLQSEYAARYKNDPDIWSVVDED